MPSPVRDPAGYSSGPPPLHTGPEIKIKIKIKIKGKGKGKGQGQGQGKIQVECFDLAASPRSVIPANAGIQFLPLLLPLLLISGPVVGAEQRRRASGKGATV